MEINEPKPNECKGDFYLLITEVVNKTNSGTLIRSASAFNCKKILIVSKDKKILKKFFGSQGTVKKMQFEFFDTLEQINQYCTDNNIIICGIENNKEALPIQKTSFKGNTLFILGSGEMNQLSDEIKEICNQYTYVEQYGYKGKGMNTSIIGSIVFHHFALWAGYQQAGLNSSYNNEKFVVNELKANNKANINNN